jgi:hypothetical protein
MNFGKYSLLTPFFILLFYAAHPESVLATPNEEWITQWRADIDTLQSELEARHIDLYHKVSEEEFTAQLTEIKRRLPALSQSQLMVELMRASKLIGDGHTQVNYWGGTHSRYPLKLRMFGDDIRVVATDQTNKPLLGLRLHSIDGTPVDDLKATLKPVLLGVENVYSERHQLTTTLTVAEVLLGLGITSNAERANFTLTNDRDQLVSVQLESLPPESFDTVVTASIEPPLPPGFVFNTGTDGVALYLNKKTQTAYIDFDSYPPFSAMQNFARDLPEIFVKHEIKNVIIDLRQNGGGDFFVGLVLAWGLVVIDSLDWKQGFYVLTSGQTFSAAMSNAAQYRQTLNATLVGEPSGANPVGYQDADTFLLPYSQWKVMYSKRLYRFQESISNGVQPDKFLAQEWKAFSDGRDNQLEWIMKSISDRARN